MKKIRIILNFLVATLAAVILLNHQKFDSLPLDEKPYFALFLLMAVVILALSIGKIYILFKDLSWSVASTMAIIVLGVIMGIFTKYSIIQSLEVQNIERFLVYFPCGIILVSALDYLATIKKT